MDESNPETIRLSQLRRQEPEAVEELYARYASRLAKIADGQMCVSLKRRVDGEDVVQSVFRSFLGRVARDEFRFGSSAELWRLLVTITVRKSAERARHHQAAKRDFRAEASDDDGERLIQTLSREPDPAEAAMLAEIVSAAMEGLPAEYATILEMRLAGESSQEIGDSIKVSRQTVHRALTLIESRLQRQIQ